MSSSQVPVQSDASETPTVSTTTVTSSPPAPSTDTQSPEQPFAYRPRGPPSRPVAAMDPELQGLGKTSPSARASPDYGISRKAPDYPDQQNTQFIVTRGEANLERARHLSHTGRWHVHFGLPRAFDVLKATYRAQPINTPISFCGEIHLSNLSMLFVYKLDLALILPMAPVKVNSVE
ncbi:hypothetical protein V8E53_013412 [Lactarius tabidus]